MASITINNFDKVLERRLRTQAEAHGHSIEDEARDILHAALNREPPRKNGLLASIRAKIAPLGGVDLPPSPATQCTRQPPSNEVRVKFAPSPRLPVMAVLVTAIHAVPHAAVPARTGTSMPAGRGCPSPR